MLSSIALSTAASTFLEIKLAENMDQDEINTFLNMLNKIRTNIE